MRRSSVITAKLATITTALLLGIASTDASAAAPSAASGRSTGAADSVPAATPKASVITLITGDTVRLEADGRSSVVPAKGRERTQFVTQRLDGHLHVTPADALGLVARNKLDSRLFDVTALQTAGYGDGRTDLPLIIRHESGVSAAAAKVASREAIAGTSAKAVVELPALRASAIHQPKNRLPRLWRNLTGGDAAPQDLQAGVAKVWLDGVRKPSLDRSVPQIGADKAWAAGQDGTGALVAVLDTGIDATHPDLAKEVVGAKNFTTDPDGDQIGHGTHVASTIAGSGAASAGKLRGVAPGARLLDGKVCVKAGGTCPDSSIIAAMQWAVDKKADVVNMSLGGPDTWDLDPLEESVNALSAKSDTLFVISAGNESARGTIASPASADAALAVGAVNHEEEIAGFSNQGPRTHDIALKPEITAPGVDIQAAKAKDGVFGLPGDLYTYLSGTSMAAPHVVGAAAILAAAHPTWNGARIKATLIASAKPNPKLATVAQGAGRVDVARAIGQQVTASPATLTFGLAIWPHTDDPKLERTLTYRNNSAQPLKLTLALSTDGPKGAVVPAGMFSLSAPTLTVPAGGTSSVTVRANTRLGDALGTYGGQVTATAGDQVVRTPFVVEREANSHDLTVRHTGRDGKAPENYSTSLYRLDNGEMFSLTESDGVVQARIPAARYLLVSWIYDDKDPADPKLTLISQPLLDLDRDRTVVVDARLARPVSVTAPRRDAKGALSELDVTVPTTDSYPVGFSALSLGYEGLSIGQVAGSAPLDGFVARFSTTLAKPDGAGSFDQSPFAYHLAWYRYKQLPTGFRGVVKPGKLAEVRAEHRVSTPGAVVWKQLSMKQGDSQLSHSMANMRFTLPFTLTEYYSTEYGVKWQANFQEMLPLPDWPGFWQQASTSTDPFVAYRAGSRRTVQWNGAVFAPVLPGNDSPGLTRTGDTLNVPALKIVDNAGREVASPSTAHLTVYRNGAKLHEADDRSGVFTLPAKSADYRVEVSIDRAAPSAFSTRSVVAWTFRSGHVNGTAPQRIAASTVRFTPALDATNSAPAGRAFTIPVTIQSNGSQSNGSRPSRLSVEASYDDGASWRPATLRRTGTGWTAEVRHPGGTGFVSLRAAATDPAGNTVTQTLTRAYRFS
jgi:subtilisin family serine protease